MLSYRLHETVTGAPLSIPLHAPGRWNVSMTSIGGGSHTIPLAMTRFSRAQWREATLHWSRTLVVCWDGQPIYAGLIKEKRWRPESKTLALQTVTVDALFQDRYTFGVEAFLTQPNFEVVSKSLRAALAQLIRQVAHDLGPQEWHSWALPFVYFHEGEAGGFSKLWKNEDWATSADQIRFIRDLEGGPDLAFIPVYDENNYLRWEVRAGNPRVDGATIDLPLSVRKSRASGLEHIEDGSAMLTGVWVRGEGIGRDRVMGEAGNFVGPFMTVRDAARNVTDVDDKNKLDSMAAAQLGEARVPTVQHDFALHVEEWGGAPSFPVSDLRLGTRLRLRFSGDEYLDPFTRTSYVIGLSHDAANPHTFLPEVHHL